MHGTSILEEADRLMTVCNSCRYCEGLCAVFPAMEMRRAFSDGDLNYLANLCHAAAPATPTASSRRRTNSTSMCRKTLAIARAESYAAYAWPRAFSGLFARNGLAISLDRGAERRGVHLRLCRLERPAGAVRHPYRTRRVLSH